MLLAQYAHAYTTYYVIYKIIAQIYAYSDGLLLLILLLFLGKRLIIHQF